jgi:alpha-D-xyloside xylohydrolase
LIQFKNEANNLLFTEKEPGAAFVDFNDAGVKTYTVSQSFKLENDEAIYGLGQQQEGKMSKRGVKLNMVQGNTDDYIPFFQSSKGYGVFWDNYSPTVFDDNTESTSFQSV